MFNSYVNLPEGNSLIHLRHPARQVKRLGWKWSYRPNQEKLSHAVAVFQHTIGLGWPGGSPSGGRWNAWFASFKSRLSWAQDRWENQSYGHSTILDEIPQVYKGHTYTYIYYIKIARLVLFIYICIYWLICLFTYLLFIFLSLSLQRHPEGSICSFIYLFI